MENRRIKSAAEIALEKTADMPRLTEKERRSLDEREFKPHGEALAKEFLEGSLSDRDLQTAFLRYKEPQRDIVKKSFLLKMTDSVTLEDARRILKALDGIRQIIRDATLDEYLREAETTAQEFHKLSQQRHTGREVLEKKKLEGLGISGSAVRPNLGESDDWRDELREITADYASRMHGLRNTISVYLSR